MTALGIALALGGFWIYLVLERWAISRALRRHRLQLLGLVRTLEHRAAEEGHEDHRAADHARMLASDLRGVFPEFFTGGKERGA